MLKHSCWSEKVSLNTAEIILLKKQNTNEKTDEDFEPREKWEDYDSSKN